MENARVEIDKQRSQVWNFPAYEPLSDSIKSVSIEYGRQSERDKFMVGTCDVELEVDRDNLDFVVNYEEPEYVNGFTRACSDYLGALEGTLTIFANADATFEGPNGTGQVQLRLPRLTSNHSWRLGPDLEYLAEVTPHKQYVPSFALREVNGATGGYPLVAYVYWFSESGGFIKRDIFYEGEVAVDVEARVHGVVTAPSGAAYASLGADAYVDILGSDMSLRFSKFMIHQYDAVYEQANGTPLKPFALGELYGRAAQVSTSLAAHIPGNQFVVKDCPKASIGSNPRPREMSTVNIAPSWLSMNALTAANIGSFLSSNRVTKSVITTDSVDGTQCVRAETTALGTGTHALYLSPNSAEYPIAVIPGKSYKWSVWLKNIGTAAATFNLLVRGTNNVTATIAGNRTIGAKSAWINYTGTWTAPTDVRSAYMMITFNAAGYDIYVDKHEVFQRIGTEPPRDYNYLGHFGDFEGVTSSWLAANTMGSSGRNVKTVLDNTVGAPSGTKFISLDKPADTANQYICFAKSLEHFVAYVEPGRTYVYSAMVKKTTPGEARLWLGLRFNDTPFLTNHDYSYQVDINDDWTLYEREFTTPATASAANVTLVLEGVNAAEFAQVYVDDVSIRRVPVKMLDDLSSIDEANLTRTTVYQVEAINGGPLIYLMYGNDVLEDASTVFKWQHSGKTRTRFKATLQYAGYDLPVGTTVRLLPTGTNGRGLLRDEGLESRGYRGIPAWDAAQVITMPTADNPTVELNLLAPDIPWRAWTFALVFDLPPGKHLIGYTYTNEYIGPDGYEDEPGSYEEELFAGKVEARNDDPNTLSIEGRRVYPMSLTCMDKSGALARMELGSPYQSIVLRDEPLAYLPLHEDSLSDIAGRLSNAPYVLSAGTPNEWGLKYDNEKTLVGYADNEGGSYKFIPSGSPNSGQVIVIDDPTLQAGPGKGSSVGVWFSHTAPVATGVQTILVQAHSRIPEDESGRGAYVELHSDGIYAGVFLGAVLPTYPNLDSDGLPHYVVVSSDGETQWVYLDGVLIGTDTIFTHYWDRLYIGGEYKNGQFLNMFNGHIGHVEVYDYALSGAEVKQHWKQGKNLRKGGTELERIEHILSLAQDSGIPPIVRDRYGNVPESVTTLGAPTWKSGAKPLDLLNSIAEETGGQVFAGPGGRIIYENRRQRFSKGGSSNQSWLIGEGSSIIPEGGSSVSYDYDKLLNEVVISIENPEGEASIERHSARKSIYEYGKFSDRRTYNLETADQAKYMAQWLVNTNKEPYYRFSQLRFSYDASPETAEFCMKVRISDHVHGDLGIANGAGIVDGFVEKVIHTLDGTSGYLDTWTTTIQVSPARNQLVAKLNDATYGKLDGGYRLGY